MKKTVSSRLAIFALGGLIFFSALLQLGALLNELVALLVYWLYVVCIPSFAIWLLSMMQVCMKNWGHLFVPASLVAFLSPFICWEERSLADNAYVYSCVLLSVVGEYWLMLSILDILQENFLCSKKKLYCIRHVILYGSLVPMLAFMVANVIIDARGTDAGADVSYVIWIGRMLFSVSYLHYFRLFAMILVACVCLYFGVIRQSMVEQRDLR